MNFTFSTTCLEVNNRLEMNFTSTVTVSFVTQLEDRREFIRDTATVTVVQGISVTRYIIAITTELYSTIVFIPISCCGTGEYVL